MKIKQVKKIIDPQVRAIVLEHLELYEGDPKKAFTEEVTVLHSDGKTPIKRVRVLQSKTTLNKLENSKFAVRDQQGKAVKWVAYGNIHHVEIVRNRQSDKVSGVFITMMEAAKRAKGIGMNKQPLVQTDHGPNTDFLLALHKNDLVSVEKEEERKYYRVQLLDSPNKRIKLRLHTASTVSKLNETLKDEDSTVVSLMGKNLKLHHVNAIGKLIG
jgi:CRISPR-associated endonuclease Csn1